jgi:nicotinamidase-related amidase
MLAAMADTIDPFRSVLVLVDYQSKLLPAIHEGRRVLANAVRLADAARLLGVRIVATEENPDGLGPNDPAIRSRCDATLAKRHFDACADGLVALLAKAGDASRFSTPPADAPPLHVVIAGCETHVCLLQTALGLLAAGLRVFVVADACGSRSPADHVAALDRLRAAGAVVVTFEMVVFEWLRTCDHPKFREALGLVKAKPVEDEFRWDDASPG